MSVTDSSQLDLFASLPEAASPPVRPAPRQDASGLARQPEAPQEEGRQPAAAAASGDLLRHPRATHQAVLGGQSLAYELKRARRRSIGMQVSDQGLSVSAPKWVSLQDIEQALQTKASWILRKLADQRRRVQRLEASRIEWRDGASLPYLGAPATLRLSASAQGAILVETPEDGRVLVLGMSPQAEPEQIRDRVQGWLQQQARQLFQARCQHYAQQLGVKFSALKLSSAQTRWGSATADGVIRLNWRLIHFSASVIDYVVAHELAHLREMNHSPRFWDVVRSVMPDYEQIKGQLRHELVAPLDD